MLELLDLRGDAADLGRALAPRAVADELLPAVQAIVAEVRERGDAALRALTTRFDGASIDELEVPAPAVRAALDDVPVELRAAIEHAADEIRTYHEAQRPHPVNRERDGLRTWELIVPVARAGCYVPGGRAVYPSTVLMTVVPARVAGVPEVVVCVPPGPDGAVPAPTLAAAACAGADAVFRVGGAQAIAALAYGTESIRPVDVIVGPGNRYVSEAKRLVADRVGVDAYAGPSEVVVVADGQAQPELVAADLLAQAEHGPGGVAVLVTWDEPLVAAVESALARRVAVAPRAAEIEATLGEGGRAILVRGPADALDVVNTIAPEHLELLTDNAESLLPLVRNAGAVFCGPWTPAVVGDYLAGVNHVLPTARTARFASALRIDDFQKRIHVVRADRDALADRAPDLETLAEAEGLVEHARAVALRVDPAAVSEAS